MINRNNLPADKKGAEIALKAMKSEFLTLAQMIQYDLTSVDEINDYCWLLIKAIDEVLDE